MSAFKRLDLPVRMIGIAVCLLVLSVLIGIGVGVVIRTTFGAFE